MRDPRFGTRSTKTTVIVNLETYERVESSIDVVKLDVE